ncbi:hypothetical protein ACIQCF_37445 [Streptomyces sp. NPDC088353]|uniref:hypothetical protein n=1 Tax=unclassified Streptomyces TaxID=2593676 RepID=UPI0036B699A3
MSTSRDGSVSGSWYGQTFEYGPGKPSKRDILVRGSRNEDEGVMIKVGATTGSFNTFNYGDTVTIDTLPLTY